MTENITSDSNGLYSKDYSILKSYSDVNLNISFQGNNDFTTQSISKTYNTIINSKTTLSLSSTKSTMTTKTESSVITAKLVDANNQPIPNTTITLSKGTYVLKTATTNSNGEISYTYPATEGTATINAKYEGNTTTYDSSSASLNITVSITKTDSTVSISLSSTSITRGNSITITVSGKGTINIGTSSGSNNIGTVSSSGTVSYTPSSSTTIYAVSSGDADYNGASNSAYITVNDPPSPSYTYHSTSLSISGSTNVISTNSATYTINKNGIPSGATISYYLDDSLLGSTTGNTFTATIDTGNHTLKVVYGGQTIGYDVYNGSNATLSVNGYVPDEPNPDIASTASISVSSNNVVWGEAVTLTANTNVPNSTIWICYGSQSNSVTTNSSGTAYLSVSFSSPQTASAWVEIHDISGYTDCTSGSISITVKKRATSFGNLRTQIAKGEAWSCIIMDEKNSNVSGRKVHITNKLYNTTTTSDLGWSTSQSSGLVETIAINYDLKNAYIGFYPTFGGDDYYEGCTDGVWCNYNSAGA